MRHPLLVAAAFMLATTASSWAQDTSEGTPHVKQPDQENVAARNRDTLDDIRDYSAEQKDEAVRAARHGLDQLDARIEEMSTHIDASWKQLSQQTRLKKQQALGNLKEQRAELETDYQRLQAASADNWEAAKTRFGDAWQATKQAWRALTEPAAEEQ
jgi:DNA repair exonuclease SbcCD ATPase subunit